MKRRTLRATMNRKLRLLYCLKKPSRTFRCENECRLPPQEIKNIYPVYIELKKHEWKSGRTRKCGGNTSRFFEFSQTFTSVTNNLIMSLRFLSRDSVQIVRPQSVRGRVKECPLTGMKKNQENGVFMKAGAARLR